MRKTGTAISSHARIRAAHACVGMKKKSDADNNMKITSPSSVRTLAGSPALKVAST